MLLLDRKAGNAFIAKVISGGSPEERYVACLPWSRFDNTESGRDFNFIVTDNPDLHTITLTTIALTYAEANQYDIHVLNTPNGYYLQR
jgi:hypothetical protein